VRQKLVLNRLYPDRPIVGIGAIIIRDGKILLERRGNEPGKGKWSVPGGIVELGESPELAVIREVEEETNLEVWNPVLMDVVNSLTVDETGKIKYHFVIIDYFVKVQNGETKAASDAKELAWVPLKEVFDYSLTSTIREFFERNMRSLKKLDSRP
jgi:8-oxo-dGTP diphosphatase